VDPDLRVEWSVKDGDMIRTGDRFGRVSSRRYKHRLPAAARFCTCVRELRLWVTALSCCQRMGWILE